MPNNNPCVCYPFQAFSFDAWAVAETIKPWGKWIKQGKTDQSNQEAWGMARGSKGGWDYCVRYGFVDEDGNRNSLEER